MEEEHFQRSCIFIPCVPESIAGILVSPLTYEMELRLRSIKSPFFCGGVPSPADVAIFFWAVSEEYQRSLRVRWAVEHVSPWVATVLFNRTRRAFVRRLRKLDYLVAVKGIYRYINEAYSDSPSGGKSDSVSYYSEAAGLVILLADKCSMSRQEVMNLPIKIIWQLLRAIERKENPEAIQFNPSDKIRGEWLKQKNAEASK